MSLNIHGVGASQKHLAFKRLFEVSLSNVILLQEMMVLGYKETKIFLNLLLERDSDTMDPIGLTLGECYQHGTVKAIVLVVFTCTGTMVERKA